MRDAEERVTRLDDILRADCKKEIVKFVSIIGIDRGAKMLDLGGRPSMSSAKGS